MSQQLYANNAERQRAYRARRQAEPAPTRPRLGTAARKKSRPARLALLIAEVQNLSSEYQNWLERLPENLAEGTTAAQLGQAIAQLDEVRALLEDLELPVVGKPQVPEVR